jgi:hypothetical protein
MKLCISILYRLIIHDYSKYQWKESKWFSMVSLENTKNFPYGHPALIELSNKIKPGIKAHKDNHANRHHPDNICHNGRGFNAMNLVDVVECFADWKAAGRRNKGGGIDNSVERNQSRFGMTNQLVEIFKNTDSYFWNRKN